VYLYLVSLDTVIPIELILIYSNLTATVHKSVICPECILNMIVHVYRAGGIYMYVLHSTRILYYIIVSICCPLGRPMPHKSLHGFSSS
jgi:hypothetical protein